MPLTSTYVSGHDLRSCCRCGAEFRVESKERICPACRKPKRPHTEPLRQNLTLREKQIIDLVRQAKLNKEIAYILHLSEGTIKEYLNKIFRKLEVKNRTELAVWSLSHPEGRISMQPEDARMRDTQSLPCGDSAILQ
ncbi:MAG TPA: LuxR C-terminal-related transcriptional regulator [Bryobacteraceae bacterium]|nr:LuxR C-terminal-related transcriptional regulator [Bryobacteraceae bacterium]